MNDTIETLWENYLFLTREMVKLLERENMDRFYDLLDQREQLQQQIDAAATGKPLTKEIRDIINQVEKSNQNMTVRLRLLQNQLTQKRVRSHAYEGIIPDAFRGHRGDWKT